MPGFSWGPLEALDYLPRVRAGRLVLSMARWRLSEKEVEAVGKDQRSLRFLAVPRVAAAPELAPLGGAAGGR